MVEWFRKLFTPREILLAREKRRLEAVLQTAGLSRKQRMRVISEFFSGKNDCKAGR